MVFMQMRVKVSHIRFNGTCKLSSASVLFRVEDIHSLPKSTGL